MAKYLEPFEDYQTIFRKLIATADLERFVRIKLLAVNTLKEIGKVSKASDLVSHMTGNDVIILYNEKIFERLSPQQQIIVAEDLLARIAYDAEKSALTIKKPDFQGFSLILRKYTYPVCDTLNKTIKELYALDKAAEDQAAQAKTAKVKNKTSYQKA